MSRRRTVELRKHTIGSEPDIPYRDPVVPSQKVIGGTVM